MSEAIVVEEGVLVGEIRSEGILSGSVVSEGTLRGSLSMPVGYEDYTGPYAVTPKIVSQSLNTADKHMSSDVTHIAMIGNCSGTILNDFFYYEMPTYDIRKLIYTDKVSNLEKNLYFAGAVYHMVQAGRRRPDVLHRGGK